MERGASGNADESGSSFKSANEEAVPEGKDHKPQILKCVTMDRVASGKTKKLVVAAAAVVVSLFYL
jgi:hypothetical protein